MPSELKNKTLISAQGLDLGYKRCCIVSKMNLTIEQGEFIGILGPNGAGKSTFFRTLLGFIKPLNGKLDIFQAPPCRGNTHIGFMPQTRVLGNIGNLSSRALLEAVYDGLRYGLPLYSAQSKKEIQQILELVEAQGYADRPFRQLSGGERQRIYLAQAILGKPQLLLLDEPLSNLDPRYQDKFMVLLKHIQDSLHATILFTAHDPNPLLPIMNRVLFFANGKAAIGETKDIMTSEKLSSLYDTPIEVLRFKEKVFVFSETQPNIFGEVRHHHD